MRKTGTVCILAVLFIACPTDTIDKTKPIEPEPQNPVTPEQVDPAFWFKEVYDELIVRVGEIDSDNYSGPTGEDTGQIANVQYICNAINAMWGDGTVTPVSGTELQAANCEYLLKMIDEANGGRTSFGTNSFATRQIVDVIAVNDAVNRLWRPAGKFVAVDAGGNIEYSTDGIDWISITVDTAIWRDITYGDGKFVAVGNSGNMAYSTDGVTWSTPITVGTATWNAVTYGNGKFIAVGNSGNMAYSTDGVNWTQIAVGTLSWQGVTYGNGKFVAVGGADGGTASGRISSSSDGITWSDPITAGTWSWYGVTYGNGRFVAVGGSTDGSSGRISSSTDGITWSTPITVDAPGASRLRGATYGNGRFVAVGEKGGISSSSDGITWSDPATVGIWFWLGVTYGNGKYIAVGNSGSIAYSTDGNNWTQTAVGTAARYGVTYGGY